MISVTEISPADQLVRSLYRLGRVQRELARHALAELGSQGFSALAIVHKEGPVSISDVARGLSVDLSVASRQVGALARAGYVRRDEDADDGRVSRISTTPEGVQVLTDSHRRMVRAFAGALGTWEDEDVVALADGLERLRDDFAATAAHPMSPQEVAS